ncbi:OmpA family protein, partial [Hoeflea sp. BAL378]|uniref:OmpA family protein n=1 Tax=Hoeflea sp. BAL378 TaxID=1547437 RepID=UPI0013788648
ILSDLAEGTAAVSGRVLNLEGQAVDGEAFRRIQQSLSERLPGGVTLGTADIGAARGQALEWSARREGDLLTLSGSLPNEEARDRLLAAAGLKFGTLSIDDAQDIAAGAPEGLEAAALAALQALSRLGDGEARIADGTVSVRGIALSEAASGEVARLLAEGLPAGFSAEPAIDIATVPDKVLPAAACQAELDRLAGLNTVLFETGQAAIADHSHGYLDRIAFAARQCGTARLEIAGHTDADGSEADNLALSQRRAQSVLEYLSAAGVSAERMRAVGYGESRPLQDNETDAGKAANRRIEFRVLSEPE